MLKKIIRRLPNIIQGPINYIYGNIPSEYKYGAVYRETYKFIKESETWSYNKLLEHQYLQLGRLLTYVYENCLYYKKIFDKISLNPLKLKDIDDIQKIPLLTKDIIRNNLEDIQSKAFNDKQIIFETTGGSSGNPFKFCSQKGFSRSREVAFIADLWDRIGYIFGKDVRMVLRGTIPNSADGIEYRPASKELICSTYYTDETHLYNYYKKMKDFNIQFIHGHVSSIAILAQFMVNNRLYYRLRAVLGASEKTYPFQRELIQQAFGTRIFSWYGMTEQVALAGACEHSDRYHIYPQYGILELVDKDGQIITKPGVLGEIVATGFNNYALPFIRYRTGDLAKYDIGFCEYCGRKYKLLKEVEGRNYEYVITKSGNKISLTGLIFGQHFNSFAHILKIQVYQEKPGCINIRIVKGKDFLQNIHEREILNVINKAVGSELDVQFSYLQDIPATYRGKHRFLVQKIV